MRALAGEAPPTEVGRASASWTPSRPPKTETPSSSTTYVLNQNILNDGCNFGTAFAKSWQDTNIVVEHVVQIDEGRHSQAMASMAETTNLDHQQQMANVIRDAHDALQRQAHEAHVLLQTQAQNHASDTQRIQQEAGTAVRNAERMARFATSVRMQQLALALELRENERVQLLARAP